MGVIENMKNVHLNVKRVPSCFFGISEEILCASVHLIKMGLDSGFMVVTGICIYINTLVYLILIFN